jgi:DNA-directed RNA polymerase II subunit RPB1
MDNNIAD